MDFFIALCPTKENIDLTEFSLHFAQVTLETHISYESKMIVNCVSVIAHGPPYITYFREGLRTIIPGGKSDLGDLITLACALCENVLNLVGMRGDTFISLSILDYRIVASTNTCYYSENQIFYSLE